MRCAPLTARCIRNGTTWCRCSSSASANLSDRPGSVTGGGSASFAAPRLSRAALDCGDEDAVSGAGRLRQPDSGCLIQHPDEASVEGMNPGGGKVGTLLLENLMDHRGLIGSAGQKHRTSRVIQHREGKGNPVGI